MGRRRLSWFLLGLAAAIVFAAMAGPRVAHAQEKIQPEDEPFPKNTSRPSRQRLADPPADEGEAAPGIPSPIPLGDPSLPPPENDDIDPQPRAGQRPVVQDGDPNTAEDAPQLRDGVIEPEEPLAPEDGTDPSTIDTRPPEEAQLFDNPPAPPDPLLFQVEDLDPIAENRTVRRLATLDPYDPLGIRVGNFVCFPELEVGGSWYSNVLRSTSPRSDWALDVLPSMRLVSNWSRHALEVRASGDLSYFSSLNSEDDRGFLTEARGRLDITRRTNLQALVSHERSQESRSAVDARLIGSRVNQDVDKAELAVNHRFNRLSLQLRGSATDYTFGDAVNQGIATSNADRNRIAYEETVRVSWEFKPTLSAFTEVAINQHEYGLAGTSDLINRSSNGERYRFGLSFGNTGKMLRGEISLGYGVQTPDDRRLRPIDGLIIDANTTWRMTEKTSLLFNARSDFSETTTANVGTTISRGVGFEARHAFRQDLVASAGISYTNQSSGDGIIDDREVRATLGLEYFLNRETVLFGRYAHTRLNAVGTDNDYSSDEVHLGMRLRR